MYEKVLNFIDYYKGYYKIKPQKAINTHTPITEIHMTVNTNVWVKTWSSVTCHTLLVGDMLCTTGLALSTQGESANPLWVYE